MIRFDIIGIVHLNEEDFLFNVANVNLGNTKRS